MNEMVERVAKVLADHAGDGRDYTDVARAAIAAIREPTDRMRDAMQKEPILDFAQEGGNLHLLGVDAARIFASAITSALEE